jgi:hypothetical protein
VTAGGDFPPRRSGERPGTTPTNPHTQLEQQPSDDRPRRRLEALLADLPGVVWADSLISVPGARALTLPPDQAAGPREAFMIGTEFAHLHPAPDSSLHVALPPDIARQAIDAGWAEQHPVAARGLIPEGTVMLYAPRDDAEADVVARLVSASYDCARGTTPGARG